MKKSYLKQAKSQRACILFAFLSQSIWLPIFVVGWQGQYLPQTTGQVSRIYAAPTLSHSPPIEIQSSILQSRESHKIHSVNQTNRRQDTGIVLQSSLNHDLPPFVDISRSLIYMHVNNNVASMQPGSFVSSTHLNSGEPQLQRSASSRYDLRITEKSSIRQLFTRSDLLGGTLTLQNMNEPLMPAIARAERAQWIRSGDPLAPLPEVWREPMRRALNSLAPSDDHKTFITSRADRSPLSIDTVRFVHVPSSKVSRPSEIPLALQPDGSVDIFNNPDDPVVIEEINRWSLLQRLPEKGKVTAAVVHIHPFSPESSLSATPKTLSSNLQPQPRTHASRRSQKDVPVAQGVVPPVSSSPQPLRSNSPAEVVSHPPSATDSFPTLNPEPLVSPAPVNDSYVVTSEAAES